MQLRDAVVLVTGGTGNLGQAVVHRVLQEDAEVVTTYIDDEEWAALQELVDVDGYKADVTAAEQVDSVVTKVVEEYGRIDVLLHLAGAWKGGDPVHAVEETVWDTMLSVNLKSAFLMTRSVLPHMREHGTGRIICIGSKTGHELPANGGPYAIAKHGLEALTRIVASENQDAGITMNCILPSVIDTPDNREALGTDNVDDWVSPDEIADLIVETATDPGTNGESIPIYGGIE